MWNIDNIYVPTVITENKYLNRNYVGTGITNGRTNTQ